MTDTPHRSVWQTILIACIPLVPTIIVFAVQQIKHNEQQAASITANGLAIQAIAKHVETQLDEAAAVRARALAERDRMQERLNILDQRLSALEATVKAFTQPPTP